MQTITITLNLPDGVTVCVTDSYSNTYTQTAPNEFIAQMAVKPAGPTLENLKQAFLAAVKKNKDAAFKALGCAKCSEVAESSYAAVIEALNAV